MLERIGWVGADPGAKIGVECLASIQIAMPMAPQEVAITSLRVGTLRRGGTILDVRENAGWKGGDRRRKHAIGHLHHWSKGSAAPANNGLIVAQPQLADETVNDYQEAGVVILFADKFAPRGERLAKHVERTRRCGLDLGDMAAGAGELIGLELGWKLIEDHGAYCLASRLKSITSSSDKSSARHSARNVPKVGR
jgi:hypothetical protein